MAATRFLASLGSAIGNLTLFGAVAAAWPGYPPPCCFGAYDPGGRVVVELGRFRPWIVDPERLGWPSPEGPDCPRPLARGGAFHMEHAPLPLRFDPAAWPGRKLFACVRVDEHGEVLGVMLIGVEERAVAAALTGTINRDWIFSPRSWRDEEGWLRVRLNMGGTGA